MNLKKLIIAVIFTVMIVAWISSSVMTVIPDTSASKICYLGYKAHCSFTPISTLISVVAAIITFLIAKRLVWS
jgi:hypothetical protein